MTNTWLLRRTVFADQFPKGADLRDAARDSVIRCAVRFGLSFKWDHDQHGAKWVLCADGRYRPTMIPACKSTAIVTGPMPEELRHCGRWLKDGAR